MTNYYIQLLTLFLFIGPKNALSVEAEVQAETVSEKRTGEKAVASSAGPEATSQETAEARVEAQPSQMVQIAEEAEVVEVIAETEDATRTEESTTEGTRVPVAADQEVKEAGTAIGSGHGHQKSAAGRRRLGFKMLHFKESGTAIGGGHGHQKSAVGRRRLGFKY